MKVLVTGGAGFIGSHICDALVENNHEVTVIDALVAGVNYAPKGLKLFDYYIEDAVECPLTFDFDLVIHAAARADVAQNWVSLDERATMTQSNILGTEALLEECEAPVIMLSTCAVYGDNDNCQEDMACVATSPYASSKLAGEAMVQAYAFKRGTPWHVLRMGCVLGPRYHHGHIRDFVDMGDKGKITPANDGYSKKSCVHVYDVVQAVMLTVRGELGTGVYNVASGVWSPRDTIRVMGADAITEWPVDKRHGWVGDPMAIANAAKLRNSGWVAQNSLESGVKQALNGLGWK